jgi:hypothetical protein
VALLNVSFDAVSEAHLQDLVSTGVPEGMFLEYKRTTYGNGDDHSPRRAHCIPKHKSPHRLSKKCWSLSKKCTCAHRRHQARDLRVNE